MTDWEMVVETWPGGRHNFPKVTPKNPPDGPRAFTTTLRSVLATRGQFTYDDHGTPWSTVARNLTVELYRSDATNDYRGRTTISNGTVQIQSYQPFRMDMQSRLLAQRRQGALRPHGPPQRRRTNGRDRRRRSRPLARAALSAPVADRLSDAEEHLLSRAEVRRLGRRRLHRHVSSLQGRTRAEGLVRQPAGRRQRLALPEPARVGAVAARSARDHQRDERAVRRHGAVRLPDGAVRQADSGARDVGRAVQRRRSRCALGFSRDRGAAARGPRLGPEPSRMAARASGR